MGRFAAFGLGALIALAVLAAAVWFLVEIRAAARRRVQQREAAARELQERATPWASFCEPAGTDVEIGVHRKPASGAVLERRVLFVLPADGDAMERIEREGDAIGVAHDLNRRRELGS